MRRVWRVSVVLAGLVALAEATPDLFDRAEDTAAGVRPAGPGSRLARAVDTVHRRFGRASLVFGPAPLDRESYLGAKVAFARLPREEEDW